MVAILLTADRPEFTRQAVECFRAQTYSNKRLLVWDSSAKPPEIDYAGLPEDEYYIRDWNPLVIGQLRNKANEYAVSGEAFAPVDILIHLDSDDWSHPNRIAEQVALLQSSGADVVGYNEMLFWREPHSELNVLENNPHKFEELFPGEAWLYSNKDRRYPPGSSLCYWRKTWEAKPFAATSIGEDEKFCRGLKVFSVSCLPQRTSPLIGMPEPPAGNDPRMIARIHPGNTSTAYSPSKMEAEARKKDGMWKRVPMWDSFCAETMR